MQRVVIPKQELLKISKENFEKYKELYNVTLEAFNELVEKKKKELDKSLRRNISNLKKAFKEGKDNNDHIESYLVIEGLSGWSELLDTKPLDQRKAFEDSIEMIELDSRENIELSKDDYQKIVKNNWPFLGKELNKAKTMRMSFSNGPSGSQGTTGSTGPIGSPGLLEESLSTAIKFYEG